MGAYSCWGHWTHSRFRIYSLLISILDFYEFIERFIGLASDSRIFPKPVHIYSETLGLEQSLWRPGRHFL